MKDRFECSKFFQNRKQIGLNFRERRLTSHVAILRRVRTLHYLRTAMQSLRQPLRRSPIGPRMAREGRAMTRSDDFDLKALYAAMDAQRHARGLTWAQAAREISRQPAGSSRVGISTSTVTGIRTRSIVEADGVLQMLRWLNRTPESFVPGHPLSGGADSRLPNVAENQTLRFDTKRLHASLDQQRRERSLTWAQVANEVGVAATSLTHLAHGGRTNFPQIIRIARWLGRPAAHFTWACPRWH